MSKGTPFDEIVRRLTAKTGHKPKVTRTGIVTRCPAHDDTDPSLQVSERDDQSIGIHCYAGCATESVLDSVGLSLSDLYPDARQEQSPLLRSNRRSPTRKSPAKFYASVREVVETLSEQHGSIQHWTYLDIDSKPVGLVVRWDTAEGKQIRPLHKTDAGWTFGAVPGSRPLFALPELKTADCIYVAEGEKAVEALQSFGLTATTSSGGSNAASKTDWSPLAGKDVVILPDNDTPGRKFAHKVAGLLSKVSPSPKVRTIDLKDVWPEIPDAGDAADFAERCDTTPTESLAQ